MRIRSTTTGSLIADTNTRSKKSRTSCAGSFTQYATVVTKSGTETVKTIKDVVTPGFHRLLSCGKFLPLNPVEISTTTTTRTPGSGDHYLSFVGGCYRNLDTGPSWAENTWLVTVPPYDEDIIDTVVNAAIADAKEGVFDALTFIAEYKQVHSMVKDNFELVSRFADRSARFAKRFARNKRELLTLFASKWLEYRYGWSPLIHDVENAAKALSHRLERGQLITGKSTVQTSLDTNVVDNGVSGALSYTVIHDLTGTRTYRGKAYAEVLDEAMARFQADPLVTVWEIVPYSFVVDWFINVNTWLQSVSPFSGARLIASMASVKDSYTLQQDTSLLWSGTESGSDTGRQTKIEVERYVRFPHTVSLPSWNPRLTKVRLVDLAALIYQRRREVMSLFR